MPRLIAWEVTRTCLLQCRHCRGGATDKRFDGELSLEETKRVLKNIASFSKPIIILTGGEPMLREDIYEIASYANNIGLQPVLSPCGTLITDTHAKKIRRSGIRRVSISIDGADETTHDEFRGSEGSFSRAIQGIECLKKQNIEFQVNTTITRHNLNQLEDILDLSYRLGAVAFHPFLLVPTGRGKDLKGLSLKADEYENTLAWIYRQKDKFPIHFKPTCAPHYYRIARQGSRGEFDEIPPAPPFPKWGIKIPPDPPFPKGGIRGDCEEEGLKEGSDVYSTHNGKRHHGGMEAMTRGCLGGFGFAFISHTGKVQLCGFLDVECGDLREEGYDFFRIWTTSEVFQGVRDLGKYKGKCGACEYRAVCGGCRARAYAETGDYLEEEPLCIYQPNYGIKS